jgi:hypothetical protein
MSFGNVMMYSDRCNRRGSILVVYIDGFQLFQFLRFDMGRLFFSKQSGFKDILPKPTFKNKPFGANRYPTPTILNLQMVLSKLLD